jgi:hypothetical protein
MDDNSTKSWDAIADDWTIHADNNDYKNIFLMPHTLALFHDLSYLTQIPDRKVEGWSFPCIFW